MKTPCRALGAIVSLCLCLATYSASAKLVAWYPMNESDEVPASVTENVAANHAAMVGYDVDPAVVTRIYPSARPDLGTAYRFDKGGALNLTADAAVQSTDKFTISFWFQPLTFDAFDRYFESLMGNAAAQDGIRIDMGAAPGNKIRVLVRDGSGGTTQSSHPLTLKNDGTWYFFAFRYDSAGVDNPAFKMTAIEETGAAVDAAAIASGTAGPNTVTTTAALHYPHGLNTGTMIGSENVGATGGNTYNGGIDEIAFFDNSDGNGVLSDAALADVYNFGPSGVDLITSFTSNAASVEPGGTATFSWNVTDPLDSLSLIDSEGNVTNVAPDTTAGAGSRAVTLTSTTTYWLKAVSSGAENTSTKTILAGAPPLITSFNAATNVLQNGSSIDLNWTVAGAVSLSLDPGATDVTGLTTSTVTPTETTTYTLSANNAFGTSTADFTVLVFDGPIPAFRYVASTVGNTEVSWQDEIGSRDWGLTGALYNSPLVAASDNTNISASYSTNGGISGGVASAFQAPDLTAEFWIRPAALTADHQHIFESGGGQNGLAVLMNDSTFRFIGSAANVRTLDITVPVAGLNLADFIQIVFSTSATSDAFEVAVRDTFGNVRTASVTADVSLGGNGAGLFYWGAGALGGDNNLGGRTELPDVNPEGLSGFAGEIGIINFYERLLSEAEIQTAFDVVATTVDPPSTIPFMITNVERDSFTNEITLTWNSIDGHLYDSEFSTNLVDWFNLNQSANAVSDETTKVFTLPPNQPQFYIRLLDIGLD
jgi:hypothetical protein